jgi:hypothetical protein
MEHFQVVSFDFATAYVTFNVTKFHNSISSIYMLNVKIYSVYTLKSQCCLYSLSLRSILIDLVNFCLIIEQYILLLKYIIHIIKQLYDFKIPEMLSFNFFFLGNILKCKYGVNFEHI